MLEYNSDNIYSSRVGSKGIADHQRKHHDANQLAALTKVVEGVENKTYGFTKLVQTSVHAQAVMHIFSEIKWARTIVVVGIGGSDLGGRAVQNALGQNPRRQVIFFGDTTDPNAIDSLLQQIDVEHTLFNIVSKSGGTTEIMVHYAYLKQLVQNEVKDWQRHFLFTTDPTTGVLRQEAEQNGILTLEIPRDVGGRFSVLSTVGLLPALVMGVDVSAMVAGAAEVLHAFLEEQAKSTSFQLAKEQFILHQQGVNSIVVMPYSEKLVEFGRWFCQLWAESLGKQQKGILPILAVGPTDQHSQLQFYMEGPAISSFLFLRIQNHTSDHKLERVTIPGLEYLSAKSFAEIINIEQTATSLALLKAGRPNATLTVSELDARSLGALFMTFELAVAILGELLEVNAFDQPGVEESKQMMYALLGKEGFEEKLKEIRHLQGEMQD